MIYSTHFLIFADQADLFIRAIIKINSFFSLKRFDYYCNISGVSKHENAADTNNINKCFRYIYCQSYN